MPSTLLAQLTPRSAQRRHLNNTMLSRPCEQRHRPATLGTVAEAHCDAGAMGPQKFAAAGIAKECLSALLNDMDRGSVQIHDGVHRERQPRHGRALEELSCTEFHGERLLNILRAQYLGRRSCHASYSQRASRRSDSRWSTGRHVAEVTRTHPAFRLSSWRS